MKKFLLSIARSNISAIFIGYIFQYFSFLLPLHKEDEDRDFITFKHPVPYWEFHLLAVPKMRIRSFSEWNLKSTRLRDVFRNLLSAIQNTCRDTALDDFQIVINGGNYQEVPQIHFHIASGSTIKSLKIKYTFSQNCDLGNIVFCNDSAILIENPNPQREKHYIIRSREYIPSFPDIDFTSDPTVDHLLDMFMLGQDAVRQLQLKEYSFIVEINKKLKNNETIIHLVSGKNIKP